MTDSLQKKEIFQDIFLITCKKYNDKRGYFIESYNREEFASIDVNNIFVQDNLSFSLKAGTIRGLHFQKGSFEQSKLLKDIAITQTNDQKNIQKIDAQLKQLNQAAKKITQLNQSNSTTEAKLLELNRNLLLLEETVQAFDSYRKQNNELMQELQLQVSSINTVNQ